MNDNQIYHDAIDNLIEVNAMAPLTPAEINFVYWAADNIRSYETTFWELCKGRNGAATIHPALHILLQLEEVSEEPLPFLIN